MKREKLLRRKLEREFGKVAEKGDRE